MGQEEITNNQNAYQKTNGQINCGIYIYGILHSSQKAQVLCIYRLWKSHLRHTTEWEQQAAELSTIIPLVFVYSCLCVWAYKFTEGR